MLGYAATLADALTPITLISGVGLILLAMSTRYNYTTDRARQMIRNREKILPQIDEQLEQSIRLIYQRAHLLKNAILAVTISAALCGLLILVTVLEHYLQLNLEVWKSTILLTAVVFIVVTTVFFVIEIQLSLQDLSLAVQQRFHLFSFRK